MKNIDWAEIIDKHEDEIEDKLIETYKEALNNKHMRFNVCMTQDGELYVAEEASGSNFLPIDVWNGNDILLSDFEETYTDFEDENTLDELEGLLKEHNLFEKYQQICDSEEKSGVYLDRIDKTEIIRSTFQSIYDEYIENYKQFLIDEFKVNTLPCLMEDIYKSI